MSRTTGNRQPARDRLLRAASEEFYAAGVSATGIDTIIAAAGVAKMSLYNNFDSKDALIAEYLAARHDEWLGLYRERLAAAHSPEQRVLAVFDAYADHANADYRDGWRGCGLLNAAAELPVGHPGRATVRAHKDEVLAILRAHLFERAEGASATTGPVSGATDRDTPDDDATDRDAPDVEALAGHLALLLEGSMAKSGLEGSDAWVRTARGLAAQLLSAHPLVPTPAPDSPVSVEAAQRV